MINAKSNTEDMEEAWRLVQAHHGRPPDEVLAVRQQRARHGAVFRSGTMDRVREALALLERSRGSSAPANLFVNEILRPLQERNLSRAIGGRRVIDRTQLILEIFGKRARTKEAKLQTELATLIHQQSRLVRPPSMRQKRQDGEPDTGSLPDLRLIEVEVVSGRQRQSGSGGSSGGGGGQGEQELADQRYRIKRKIFQLRRELKDVKRTRDEQRKNRVAAGVPSVALVGYTNSGKSSLLSILSKDEEVICQDALFVTLDPLSRRVLLPSQQPIVLSDTVGFIKSLPIELIDSFRATLEEVKEADLIVHVIDVSNPSHQQQRNTVIQTLTSLGVSPFKLQNGMIEVYNKCDLLLDGKDEEAAEIISTDQDSSTHMYIPQDRLNIGQTRLVIKWTPLLSWARFKIINKIQDVGKSTQKSRAGSNAATPLPIPSSLWLDGSEPSVDPTPPSRSTISVGPNQPQKPSRPLFGPDLRDSRRNLYTSSEEDDSRVMSALLDRVNDAVRACHSRSQYKPLALGCSARMGWGVDSILEAIEKRLAILGKLRGSMRGS